MKKLLSVSLVLSTLTTCASTCGSASKSYQDPDSPPYQKRRARPNHEVESEGIRDQNSGPLTMPPYSPKRK